MKSLSVLSIAVIVILVFNACSGSKIGRKELNIPFSDKEYQTDKDFFRAKQMGASPDLATAKKIAMQNAKAELAGNIETLMKRVVDNYTQQITVDDEMELINKFEELSRQTTSQTLNDVRTIGEKVFEEDGKYTYWVAIEMPKQHILDQMNSNIEKDKKAQLNYDKEKFEEIFNKEMEGM